MTSWRRRLTLAVALALGAALVGALPALAAQPAKLTAISTGKTTIAGKGSQGDLGDRPATIERAQPKRKFGNPLRTDPLSQGPTIAGASVGAAAAGAAKAKSNPELVLDFEGVNHFDSRTADGGNQYSGEPPDQGICVGNGYVLESVNTAVQIYNTSDGSPASPVLGLNEFYGFPPPIDRTTFTFPGPFTFDVSCHYDADSGRWFHLAVDLEQDPVTGDFTGKNYLDLAVSDSGSPLGSWTVYRIPGMNDGTEGTPDHGCTGGPCFADFPHIGMDKHGLYITTNEFELFGPDFIGAQVYAIPKGALTSGALSIPVYLFNTADDPVAPGQPGFTVWPALSPGNQFAGNKEYFVSSNAVFDDDDADSEELILWTLDKTNTLSSSTPSISLTKQILGVDRYTVPENSVQKPGTTPLRDCLADTTGAFFGFDCGLVFGVAPPIDNPLGTIDTGDSRVMDVRFANGKVWAVLGTGVEVGGATRTGVAWYVLNPTAPKVDKQGVLAVEGESLAYPTIGVTQGGRGVIGFSRVGPDLFPSVGYASLDAKVGAGPVHMIEEGRSPQDGFTEYLPFTTRARWGDYGAAAVDGNDVWLAGEYIQQGPCTLEDYIDTGFLCTENGVPTRSSFANWSTRVSKLNP